MDLPTIDEVREAKAEIVRQLKSHAEFAGAGIGRAGDRLVLRVNWRALPTDLTLPERLGKVDITHNVVGTIRPLSSEQ
jgi:hypothetical protein